MAANSHTHNKLAKPVIILLLAIMVCACKPGGSSQKHIRLNPKSWTHVSEQAGDVLDSFNYQVIEKDGGLEFSISGNPARRDM